MSDAVHVVGIASDPERPALSVRAADGTPAPSIPLTGPVRFVVGARRCVGYREGDTRHRCPEQAPCRGRQCDACAARDTFRPCMLCPGTGCPPLHPIARSRCRSPHVLYLANFGGPVVKVGTAIAPRDRARLDEQGPLAACWIASAEGPRIKRMERTLSRTTALVEAVRGRTKLAALAAGGSVEAARVAVADATLQAAAALGGAYGDALLQPRWYEPPPQTEALRDAARGATELRLSPGTLVQGVGLGCVGSTWLLRDDAGRFLIDLGALVGSEVGDALVGQTRKPSVQLGLFA